MALNPGEQQSGGEVVDASQRLVVAVDSSSPIGSAPYDDTSIVMTLDLRSGTTLGGITANQARGGRVRIPKTGTLHDLAVLIGVSSGNISAAVYDVGATTSGTRTRLWTTGAIACPTGGLTVMTILGDPALAVTQGEYLEFWLSADNATASFPRSAVIATSLPTTYPAPAGGLSIPLAIGPSQATSHPCPATLPGTLVPGANVIPIAARIA